MNAETTQPAPAMSPYGSPGMAIRDARTRAGLSLDELASRTRLTRNVLEALERDAHEQLLEPVYVRGYYRKVARTLGMNEQPLIDAYEASYTPAPVLPPARLRLASGGELGSVPRVSGRYAVLAPVVAIALCAVIWLLRDWSPSAVPGSSTLSALPAVPGVSDTQPPIDPVVEPATPEAAVDAGPVATPAGNPVTAGEVTAPVSAGGPETAVPSAEGVSPVPAESAVPAQSAAASAGQLVLVFDAISWARVEDASGKSLVSGVIGAGERRVIDGRPPYSIFLGNAPGVKVEFGGQAVDIKAFVKGNSTARFTVPTTGG